jgi:hypothetical protein
MHGGMVWYSETSRPCLWPTLFSHKHRERERERERERRLRPTMHACCQAVLSLVSPSIRGKRSEKEAGPGLHVFALHRTGGGAPNPNNTHTPWS